MVIDRDEYVVAAVPASQGKGTPPTPIYAVSAESKTQAVVFAHAYARLTKERDIDGEDIFFRGDKNSEEWNQKSGELVDETRELVDESEVQEEGGTTVTDCEYHSSTTNGIIYNVSKLKLYSPHILEDRQEYYCGIPAVEVGLVQ